MKREISKLIERFIDMHDNLYAIAESLPKWGKDCECEEPSTIVMATENNGPQFVCMKCGGMIYID